ncbi:PRD domain-containing protein [Ligilactobacillus salivarius]|uniref:PRD domain-containing protein n=1 Tax=Ligilactobacillus salivarius TaxID=1624 RepID=UPI00191FF6A8|nr:PRD domain-containing protein [Ligilactobacillus salivarius]
MKRFYPKEFTVGKEALDIINQQFGIKLPEGEAGFITMHIVEAQMNQTIDDLDIYPKSNPDFKIRLPSGN